jgi:hypothetical protein
MIFNIKEKYIFGWFSILVALAVLLTGSIALGEATPVAQEQKTFSSPEEAVKALVTAARNNEGDELIAIFGPAGRDLLSSGDAVADKQRREQFVKAFDEKNDLVAEKGEMVIVVGKNDWPFPIPLVKKGETWSFDTEKGKDELLNRRIGQDELSTIQTMLAIVDAQREYAMKDVDGDGILEYAEKFRSDPGKRNGLYWKTKEGEEPSPLGELVASARAEGYAATGSNDEPVPYHGYYFRMLKRQGEHAPGGALDYVVRGSQIGGFAVVAYPAAYGNSGVMTFVVNHDGVVYEKNLGEDTAETAKAMKDYDPGPGWEEAEDGRNE